MTNSWPTTHDAQCAALATGASAWKLGLLPRLVTCQLWDELSQELGAGPGNSGATPAAQAAWYAARGYSCTLATEGILESAAAEADKALARGCDVRLRYIGADGSAHTEVITAIDPIPDSDGAYKVMTLSWGQLASVTVRAGRYSGKTDANRYPPYLGAPGTAEF